MEITLFTVLLFVHVMAAIVWTGGAFGGLLLGMRLRAAGEAAVMGRFCQAFAEIGAPVFGGSALLLVASGTWMVIDADTDPGAPWVSIGYAGWLLSLVLGASIVGRAWLRAGQALQRGDDLAATAPMLDRAVRLTWLDLAIRVVVVFVMVWRPS